MRSARKHLPLMALVILISPLLSGCFLRTLVGGFGTAEGGRLIVFLEAGSNTAVCVREDIDETSSVYECTYYLGDPFEEGGFTVTTSTVELISNFGFLGVLIDPLILQVPAEASNFSATFQSIDGSMAGDLVTSVVDAFDVQPGMMIAAEPGQKFVILELPEDIAATLPEVDPIGGVSLDFDLSFDLPDPGPDPDPVEVKGMYAGRVDVDGQTFYIPLLPCVDDFANVPSIQIPASPTAQDLRSQLLDAFGNGDLPGCDSKVYTFDSAGDPDPGLFQVDIDIKPGSDPNSINPRSRGVIPVAILTTADFDATMVDPLSVVFGPEGASETHGKGHIEDLDGDGDLDLMLHFRTQETGIACGDTDASLTGETFDGQFIEGVDSVNTVGCYHNPKGFFRWAGDQTDGEPFWRLDD